MAKDKPAKDSPSKEKSSKDSPAKEKAATAAPSKANAKPARPAPSLVQPVSESARASKAYSEACALLREAATLSSVGSLISWDQETYMPRKGAAARAEQSALLATLSHERRTSKRLGELLMQCESDRAVQGDEFARANVREMRRDYDKATKLPADLVAELAKTGSEAQEVWKEARSKNDFAMFLPMLTKMIDLTTMKAKCLHAGLPGSELYDALLDEYEPGAQAIVIESVFTPLRKELSALIAAVQDKTGEASAKGKKKKGAFVDTTCLEHKVEPALQHEFGQHVLAHMGFDMEACRLDTTTHPFCSGLAPGDTRLTTRYRDEKFTDALYGTMHEGGHGLYEQGLPKEVAGLFGTPLADSISLGIHESQSRLWENFVGRSKHFWKWALPILQKRWVKSFRKHDVEDFTLATNTISPSLIRVEADEGTYNLHVMVRFELERGLFSGSIKPKDLPGVWNAKYKEMLGVDVPDDRRGCLQDVHWAFGLFGYFPTYTLGNLYAAQLWEKIQSDLPETNKNIAKGEMLELREWLRTNVHQHGRRFSASELCERVTGKPLESAPLLRHLRGKAKLVYGVE
jgi:carboxypeptidase Taq